ncbi:MAG: hypothetical protein O3C21_13720 [Verrucomicrobia bacterium]|nr:hypothetical protein [Verrucomicrobiota bacterium]
MANYLAAARTDLFCSVIGVNRKTDAAGNPVVSAERVLPWIQDTGDADVWTKWNVTYRDVRIVDGSGELVDVYNLSANDLGVPENWTTLAQMIADAAVLPDEDNDRLSDLWELSEFGDLTTASGSEPDHLIAYAFGQTLARREPQLEVRMVRTDEGLYSEIELMTRMGSAAGLTYWMEISADGVSWAPLDVVPENSKPARPRFDGTALQTHTFRSRSLIDQPIGFIRGRTGFTSQ